MCQAPALMRTTLGVQPRRLAFTDGGSSEA
jgi:hypothetical protein